MSVNQPTWEQLYQQLPMALLPYQVDLSWSHSRLWSLDVPVEHMPIEELVWQLELPWWRDGDRYFAVAPVDVMRQPATYPDQFERAREADLRYPISVILRSNRWFIVDGVHRLLKAVLTDTRTIPARKVTLEMLQAVASSGNT